MPLVAEADMASLSGNRIDWIDSHTIALVHYKMGQRQPDRIDSGVLVSYNGYPYLATAGHCLDVAEGETIRLAYGQESSHPISDWQDLVGTAVYNKMQRSPMDAGFAPIRAPERFLSFGKSFYKVPKDFPARLVLEKGTVAFVLGYPDELWDLLLEVSPGSMAIGSLVYRTSILATSEHSYEYEYDPDTVVEEYPPDSELPTDPTGLSGSGLWLVPPSEDEPVRLLGINIEHVASSSKCTAMFLEVWAAFFANALGEEKVRSILDDAFRHVSPIY